jgi:hypothetical protein
LADLKEKYPSCTIDDYRYSNTDTKEKEDEKTQSKESFE